jgi:hypothetical protein
MGIRSAHSEEGFIVLEDFAVWLNRKRGRVGPLFQGRFKATIHDPEESGFKVQEYIHLNPVRVKRFGASRSPPAEQVEGMLREVEEYRWSSFRAYVGLTARPQWLHMDETLRKLPGRSLRTKQAHYREHIALRIGAGDFGISWKKELAAELVLGSENFAKNPANHQGQSQRAKAGATAGEDADELGDYYWGGSKSLARAVGGSQSTSC